MAGGSPPPPPTHTQRASNAEGLVMVMLWRHLRYKSPDSENIMAEAMEAINNFHFFKFLDKFCIIIWKNAWHAQGMCSFYTYFSILMPETKGKLENSIEPQCLALLPCFFSLYIDNNLRNVLCHRHCHYVCDAIWDALATYFTMVVKDDFGSPNPSARTYLSKGVSIMLTAWRVYTSCVFMV